MTTAQVRTLAHLLRTTVAHYRKNGPEPVQYGPDEGQQWVGITPADWARALARAERLADRIEEVHNPVHAEACANEAHRLLSTMTYIPSGR